MTRPIKSTKYLSVSFALMHRAMFGSEADQGISRVTSMNSDIFELDVNLKVYSSELIVSTRKSTLTYMNCFTFPVSSASFGENSDREGCKPNLFKCQKFSHKVLSTTVLRNKMLI